ncbi:MAG: 4-alpha-glucanotransferase [Clostridiales bacterium]|nr:4-alpha-glucanotransferase [Clostridiales bacterium]
MRKSGILMHISSLPSPYGIGTMGKAAYEFVDFLERTGQSYWQILPLGQTGFGDSPYQSCSTFAGNPYFIDLDLLAEDGYLKQEELDEVTWCEKETQVDYGNLYRNRYTLLRKVFQIFKENIPEDYDAFCWQQGQWLEDYALFMAVKMDLNGASWDTWESDLRKRVPEAVSAAKQKLGMEMFFWKMLQYFFFRQWLRLKKYANDKGIQIIGDLPIYVAADSSDTWANPELFDLDEEGIPREVAGCPPDGFSPDGQLWGNPLFLWGKMQQDGYSWWMNRIRHTFGFFDVIRIDHFRGFESYYCIPGGDETARNGFWRKGPGRDFFRVLREQMGDVPIIAEDLGFLTSAVRKMLKEAGYPGMKILQFAFDGRPDNEYLPHNYPNHSVAYTGTHDNDTNEGWLETAPEKEKKRMMSYLSLKDLKDGNWEMLKAIWASPSDTAIACMQDILGLSGSARMNKPSTSEGNWSWRMAPGYGSEELEKRLYELTREYNRLPRREEIWPEEIFVAVGERIPQDVLKKEWEEEKGENQEEAAKTGSGKNLKNQKTNGKEQTKEQTKKRGGKCRR